MAYLFIHYTTVLFQCKYFCKLLFPILTVAEGWVLGLGANMFKIAGPLIALPYGVLASGIYGVIYWVMTTL